MIPCLTARMTTRPFLKLSPPFCCPLQAHALQVSRASLLPPQPPLAPWSKSKIQALQVSRPSKLPPENPLAQQNLRDPLARVSRTATTARATATATTTTTSNLTMSRNPHSPLVVKSKLQRACWWGILEWVPNLSVRWVPNVVASTSYSLQWQIPNGKQQWKKIKINPEMRENITTLVTEPSEIKEFRKP